MLGYQIAALRIVMMTCLHRAGSHLAAVLRDGTPWDRDMAVVIVIVQFMIKCDIFWNLFIFAYYMMLMYRKLRRETRTICFLCIWAAISVGLYISN